MNLLCRRHVAGDACGKVGHCTSRQQCLAHKIRQQRRVFHAAQAEREGGFALRGLEAAQEETLSSKEREWQTPLPITATIAFAS